MKTAWTSEQEQLLKEKYPVCTIRQLAELFPDKTIIAINGKAKRLKIRKAKQNFHFTPDQLEELKRDFPSTSNIDLANRFGCSIYTIENAGSRHNLKKNMKLIRKTARKNFTADHPARKFLFRKGNVPSNKGKKQAEYMTPEAIERTKATRFSKGNRPVTCKKVGYERISKDGYIQIKVGEGRRQFKLKHRVIWAQHQGSIPDGYNVQFKDGNPQNCHIENLYLISRSEQMKNENSFHARYPEEVQKLIQLKGALKRQINKINKENGNDD
jgi:hypothetical protein